MAPTADLRLAHDIDQPMLESVMSRIKARITAISARNFARFPPLKAFWLDRALPSLDFGPLARSHGDHCRIACECCIRRSGVQPWAI